MIRLSIRFMAIAVCLSVAVLDAHVTPVVVLRTQADVIRAALPGAVSFFVTNATIGRSALRTIASRAHYTPRSDTVKFFSARDASGKVVGTVVFPQIDTQHGPIEVGVMIDPGGAIGRVAVTRATVELKPPILAVEASGVLGRLSGVDGGSPSTQLSRDAGLHGMTGYVADAIAAAARRGLILYDVLHEADGGRP